MSELRRDDLSGRWVLLAPGRAARPTTFMPPRRAQREQACPFCPGHEHETPPEVARRGEGEPDAPGWRVRVVPNLYPIVGGTLGGGAHEVVIFTPDHARSFGFLTDDEAVEAMTVLRDRVAYHLGNGLAYVQAAVNHGPAAGASIEHPHAQVIALDFVPPAVTAALDRVGRAGADLVAAAAQAAPGRGLDVLDGPEVAWCPHASGFPYEMRVAHRTGGPRFDEATDAEIADVARALRTAVARLTAVVGDASYNVVVHTAPPAPVGPFHWYLEVRPRLTVPAGFELGTGVDVNIVAPEDAAAQLRTAGRETG